MIGNDQTTIEEALKHSLNKIAIHKTVFSVMSRECQNYVPVGTGTARCNRRYNRCTGSVKFCESHWCPLVLED